MLVISFVDLWEKMTIRLANALAENTVINGDSVENQKEFITAFLHAKVNRAINEALKERGENN